MHKRKSQVKLKKKYQKKQIMIVIILLMCIVSFIIIFGRYITSNIENFFVRSKEFYFESDKLSENTSYFQVENWSGVDSYTVTVNMNSRKNNIEVATYDIAYDISYTCSDNVICSLSKTEGIIYASTNTDFFNLVITPNTALNTGDKVVVDIEVKSKTNYEKTLKGRFTLIVGKENLSYQITDSRNNPYMELSITNTLSYYTVRQAFDNYEVGQRINVDTYISLSEENKQKCKSSVVRLDFDPNIVRIDITDETYTNATNITTTTIDDKTYINGLTIDLDVETSDDLRFYKVDASQDYTYPNTNNNSIINVTVL